MIPQQVEQALLPGAKDELFSSHRVELLNAQPDLYKRLAQPFRGVLEPLGKVFSLVADGLEGVVIAGAVLPIELID